MDRIQCGECGWGRWWRTSLAEEGVQLLDAASLTPMEFADDTPSSAVAFSPDGKQLAVAVNQFNGAGPPRIDALPIRLYDMPGGSRSDAQLGGFPDGSAIEYSLDFSRDGARIAAAMLIRDSAGTAWEPLGAAAVWDLSNPAVPVFAKRVPDFATTALSPDGRRLYLVAPGEHPLRIYDVDSGRPILATEAPQLTNVRENDMDVRPRWFDPRHRQRRPGPVLRHPNPDGPRIGTPLAHGLGH